MYFQILDIYFIQKKLKYKGFSKLIASQSNIEISVFEDINFTDTNMVKDAIKSSKIQHYKQLQITETAAKMRIIYHSQVHLKVFIV